MQNKSKLIITIVVFIAIAFAGYFVFVNESQTTSVSMSTSTIVYTNTTYGFNLTLPIDWKGYSVTMDTWTGYKIDDQLGEAPYATGTVVSIHNPKWTGPNSYQDIPIMVFTLDQWNLITQEKMSVGAAPIPPSELGRNAKYVFALPARYNFAFPLGYEEVDKIIQSKPLTTF